MPLDNDANQAERVGRRGALRLIFSGVVGTFALGSVGCALLEDITRDTPVEYDERGRVIRRGWDCQPDGKPDLVETWQYDSGGRVTRKTAESYECGNRIEVISWEYENGIRRRAVRTRYSDGKVIQTELFDYNEMESITRIESEFRGVPFVATFEYYPDNSLRRGTLDVGKEGNNEGVIEFPEMGNERHINVLVGPPRVSQWDNHHFTTVVWNPRLFCFAAERRSYLPYELQNFFRGIEIEEGRCL